MEQLVQELLHNTVAVILEGLDTCLPESSRTPVTRRLIYDRLHDLLRHILSLIPTLPYCPHKRQNQVAQTTYIRNLLRVSSYCTELADKILATIIDRAIQIDVSFSTYRLLRTG
jgi:RNA polymerase I-specific transcription initiation factor RRN3